MLPITGNILSFNGLFTIILMLKSNIINCDSPQPWGIYFQDGGSPLMEAIAELHNIIMFYLIIILLSVG
jgi:hypothetical protein